MNEIIGPAVIKENLDVKDQAKADEFLIKLDGTTNKTNLGANAVLGVSLSIAKAGAAEKGRRLSKIRQALQGSSSIPWTSKSPHRDWIWHTHPSANKAC